MVREIPVYPGTVVAIEIGIEARFDMAEFLADAGEAFTLMASRASKRASRAARFE
jgi:hypothetical protein